MFRFAYLKCEPEYQDVTHTLKLLDAAEFLEMPTLTAGIYAELCTHGNIKVCMHTGIREILAHINLSFILVWAEVFILKSIIVRNVIFDCILFLDR